MSQNEWKSTEIRASKVGNFSPFSCPGQLVDLAGVDDPFVTRWVDYIAFALSGRPADDTVGAAVAYTLGDLHRPGAFLDYPVGGSGAVAEALARFVDSQPGCEVRTRAHVEAITVDGAGKATGVTLRTGVAIEAGAVVSNADIWSTVGLLPEAARGAWGAKKRATEATPSFVHLWVGFDAEGVPDDLDCHHTVFNDGFVLESPAAAPVDARENMYIISIPSLFDPSLAPPGKHVAHCYAAATEPFDAWKDLDRRSKDYAAKKERAAQPLWRALEAVVPDIRKRSDTVVVGTPLTHRDFLRRHEGTYGPSGTGALSGGATPVENLWTVGDSNFPGIGVPAAAASGILVANALVPVDQHAALLDEMQSRGTLKKGTAWWLETPRPPLAPGGRLTMAEDR